MTMASIRFHKSENPSFTIEQLLDYFRNHVSAVASLSCEQSVSDEHVETLCAILQENHADANLRILRLTSNDLTRQATEALGRVLYSDTTLAELNLGDNQLGPEGTMTLIQPLLSANTSLTYLSLENNRIAPKGAKHLAQLLRNNKTILELNLSHNDIGARGIKTLAKGMDSNTALQRLHLSHNHLGAPGIRQLTSVLKKNQRHAVTFLNVSSNQATENGAQAVKEWLLYDKTLETIWLSSNDLGPAGGDTFRSVLQFNYTLREIRLGGNQLGDEGVTALSEGLKSNQHLQRLALDYNQIKDEGATALAEALKANATLEWLALNGNRIQSGCEDLAEALPYVVGLRFLNLQNNQMDDAGAAAFAESLVGVNSVFEELQWQDNALLSQTGRDALESAFRYRTNLLRWLQRSLDQLRRDKLNNLNWCSKQSIGDYEVRALSMVMSQGVAKSLTSIYLGGQLITPVGVEALCKHALSSPSSSCPNLVRLFIRGSSMGDAGASLVGEALRTNTVLKSLSLTSSGITACGADALGKGLGENTTLTRLTLGHNQLGDRGLVLLTQHVCGHPSLSSLNVMANGIAGDDGGVWEGLVRTNLRELHLQDNLLNDRATLDFAHALLDRCPFTYLNVLGNQISPKGGKALSKFLPPSATLHY